DDQQSSFAILSDDQLAENVSEALLEELLEDSVTMFYDLKTQQDHQTVTIPPPEPQISQQPPNLHLSTEPSQPENAESLGKFGPPAVTDIATYLLSAVLGSSVHLSAAPDIPESAVAHFQDVSLGEDE